MQTSQAQGFTASSTRLRTQGSARRATVSPAAVAPNKMAQTAYNTVTSRRSDIYRAIAPPRASPVRYQSLSLSALSP
jgi:hypothetical protein